VGEGGGGGVDGWLKSWVFVVGVGDEYSGYGWRNGVLIFLSGNTKVLSPPSRTRKFTVTSRIQKFDSHIYEGFSFLIDND